MANQLYNYSSSYGGGTGLSSAYSSRLNASSDIYLTDGSLIGSSRYLRSDPDSAKYSAFQRGSSLYSNELDSFSASKITPSVYSPIRASVDPMVVPGMKRKSTEALYHQNILGTHTTIGQREALYSTNSLAKYPRFETASNLPIYPQRSGEKDCAHYMLTRTCKFGDTCKFDHPLWVPEGGIPDWKEGLLIQTSESLPERPGEPDCPYYVKTQRCKFGFRCKFNHPKGKTDTSVGAVAAEAAESIDPVLPVRPSEPICSFYAKTGKCKFGANCKYHHPKDLMPSTGQDPVSTEHTELVMKSNEAADGDSKPEKPFVPFTPALLHNSKGLPIRPGETDCPFYLKTGSCKYGATCRFNHPERNLINPPVAVTLGHAMIPPAASNLSIGVFNPAANLLPNIDLRLTQTSLGVGPTIYPQRPGQTECDFYMKTGQCKFGERCKFHHPIDRSAPTASVAKQALQQNVKLTLAGLPRREGSVACPYYMKTGACKFGATCRFDHPPPGEAIAMATVQGSAAGTVTRTGVTTTEGEEKDAAGATEEQQ